MPILTRLSKRKTKNSCNIKKERDKINYNKGSSYSEKEKKTKKKTKLIKK